jgi:hypothetical protein
MPRLVLLALVACSSGKARQTCQEQVAELASFLGTIEHDGLSDNDRALVARADVHVRPRPDWKNEIPTLVVTATGLAGDLDDLEPHQLGQWLEETKARRSRDLETGRLPEGTNIAELYLAIAPDAPWERVVLVTRAAHDYGFRSLRILFARHDIPPPPPRHAIDDELDAIIAKGHGRVASELGALLQREIAACPPLVEAFANRDPGHAANSLIPDVPKALLACECAVEPARMRAYLARTLPTFGPTRMLVVELSSDARAITAPPEQPWREANKRIAVDAKRVWLATP